MSITKYACASALTFLLPLMSAASGGEGTTETTPDENSVESIVDVEQYKSYKPNVEATIFADNFLAVPVAVSKLVGTVSHNEVDVKVDGFAKTNVNSKVEIGSYALSGFSGINSMNVNSGHNALQQSAVTIAVAAD